MPQSASSHQPINLSPSLPARSTESTESKASYKLCRSSLKAMSFRGGSLQIRPEKGPGALQFLSLESVSLSHTWIHTGFGQLISLQDLEVDTPKLSGGSLQEACSSIQTLRQVFDLLTLSTLAPGTNLNSLASFALHTLPQLSLTPYHVGVQS